MARIDYINQTKKYRFGHFIELFLGLQYMVLPCCFVIFSDEDLKLALLEGKFAKSLKVIFRLQD